MDNTILKEIYAILEKDKFAAKEWSNRGLNPSNDALCKKMESLLNLCCNNLIVGLKANKPKRHLKQILIKGLKEFNSRDYDTEEKEFILDYFEDMSMILKVDIRRSASIWMYGYLFSGIMFIVSIFQKKEDHSNSFIYKLDCPSCKAKIQDFQFSNHDLEKIEHFEILQCNSCEDFFILDDFLRMYGLPHRKFKYVESLAKLEFTKEEALKRLEQIKYWRN